MKDERAPPSSFIPKSYVAKVKNVDAPHRDVDGGIF